MHKSEFPTSYLPIILSIFTQNYCAPNPSPFQDAIKSHGTESLSHDIEGKPDAGSMTRA